MVNRADFGSRGTDAMDARMPADSNAWKILLQPRSNMVD
jgi:hypothetical protein